MLYACLICAVTVVYVLWLSYMCYDCRIRAVTVVYVLRAGDTIVTIDQHSTLGLQAAQVALAPLGCCDILRVGGVIR